MAEIYRVMCRLLWVLGRGLGKKVKGIGEISEVKVGKRKGSGGISEVEARRKRV